MKQRRITRRSVLTATLGAALGATLTGCGIAAAPPAPASTPPSSAAPPDDPDLAALEDRFGGRIGVHALDTETGAALSHRGGEQFLMASTAKLPLAAAVLDRATTDPTVLDRLIRYSPDVLLEYAPVTTQNVATGMTVADLCDAALTVSDNTAANLLLDLLGGPAAVTAFVRGLGDPTTRLDRTEPDLNASTGPDNERDTTTPAAIAGTIRAVTLGEGLQPFGRDRLTAWLVANTTGDATIRAGVPAGWVVGDKTGTGAPGASATMSASSCPRTAHRWSSPSTPTPTTPRRRPATRPSPRRPRSRSAGSSAGSRHVHPSERTKS